MDKSSCVVSVLKSHLVFIPADVILTPHLGNQLGGTPVIVEGLSLLPNDVIQCEFDGIATDGQYVNRTTALCITPIMSTQGIVTVNVTRTRQSSEPAQELSAIFITSELLMSS